MTEERDFTPRPDKAVLNTLPISSWDWPRIAAFVPMERGWSAADQLFPAFWSIAMAGVPLIAKSYGRTEKVRNEAAEALLASDFTHLLMLDSDQRHPGDIVQRLARWVIDDPTRRIIGGLYFRRGEPFDPLAWRLIDDKLCILEDWQPGLVEVDMIGTGAILIERSVFTEMKKPWFYYEYEGVNEPGFNWPTEDIVFCRDARQAGIRIFLDTTIDSPHAFTSFVSKKTYQTYRAMKQNETASKTIIPAAV